ncbi:hypothetical protein IWQ60_011661, partial [Tieghemiomyces parasiticus]
AQAQQARWRNMQFQGRPITPQMSAQLQAQYRAQAQQQQQQQQQPMAAQMGMAGHPMANFNPALLANFNTMAQQQQRPPGTMSPNPQLLQMAMNNPAAFAAMGGRIPPQFLNNPAALAAFANMRPPQPPQQQQQVPANMSAGMTSNAGATNNSQAAAAAAMHMSNPVGPFMMGPNGQLMPNPSFQGGSMVGNNSQQQQASPAPGGGDGGSQKA